MGIAPVELEEKEGRGGAEGGKLSDAARGREFGVVSFRRGRKSEKFDRRMCRGREYESM